MKRISLVILMCISSLSVVAQQKELFGEAELDYFLENAEYIGSHYRKDYTTGGAWASLTAGYQWDQQHSVRLSLMLLKRHGMPQAINKVEVAAYYQLQQEHFRLRLGAFPNKSLLSRYHDFFITDSIRWHKPLMTGVSLEFTDPNHYDATIWLDWSSLATSLQRESFQVGATGQWQKNLFFVDSKLRYFHYAGFNPGREGTSVHDHGMIEATTGIKGEAEWGGLKYQLSTGVLIGLETYRKIEYAKSNTGWISHLDISAFGIGTKNTLYIGEPHFGLYGEWGSAVYWGNQFLRGNKYFKSDWYIQFIQGRGVDLRFNMGFHVSEQRLFTSQILTASIAIPQRESKSSSQKSIFPFLSIFGK